MKQQSNKKKILFLYTAEYPFGNGETFLETEMEFLSKKFDKIEIITHLVTSETQRELPNNVFINRLIYNLLGINKITALFSLFDLNFWQEMRFVKRKYNKKNGFGIIKTALVSMQNAKRLAKGYNKIIKEYNNMHIYCYSYWCNDSALALAILKEKCGSFIGISRIHGWDVFFEPSKYNYLPYRSYISNNLNKIFSISQCGMDYCNTVWQVESGNIKLSRLGVKKQSFNEISTKKFTVVSCSNVIPLKRVELIIYALAQIDSFLIKWIHFGGGSYLDSVKMLAKKELKNNVEVDFKGRVSNSVVINFYNDNTPHLFINVSSSEGVPVSIMEAMSFGIPCIATSVGGTSEIVNNENGYLLSSNPTREEVALKIEEYFNLSIEDKNNKRHAAWNTWNTKYNAEKNYTEFVEEIFAL